MPSTPETPPELAVLRTALASVRSWSLGRFELRMFPPRSKDCGHVGIKPVGIGGDLWRCEVCGNTQALETWRRWTHGR